MNPTQIAQALRGIQGAYADLGHEAQMQAYADFVRQNNLSSANVAEAARMNAVNPAGQQAQMWTPELIDALKVRYAPYEPSPQYGLGGAYDTLSGGAAEATRRIGETQDRVSGLFQQGLDRIEPFMQPGVQANQLQAALSGALGGEAQRQAFQDYQFSPGVDFARTEAERALTRNAAALGGLGGANVRRDLAQLGTGFALQDFGNQFARLGEVAQRGYGAATTGAGMGAQEAGIQAGLGQFSANIPIQTASQQAQMQFQAGRDIAQGIGSTTSALAQLQQQGGAGMAGMIGNQANQISSLYQQAAAGDANARAQLAQMMQSLNMTASGQVAGAPAVQAPQTNYLGQVGQLAGGVGGLLAGMGGTQPQPAANQPSAATTQTFNTQYTAPSFLSF